MTNPPENHNPEDGFQEDRPDPGCLQLSESFLSYGFSRKLSISLQNNHRIKITQAWKNYKLSEFEIIFIFERGPLLELSFSAD
jgi:hypothetical protein